MRPTMWFLGLAACAPDLEEAAPVQGWEVAAETVGWQPSTGAPAPIPLVGAGLVSSDLIAGGDAAVLVTGVNPGSPVVLLASTVGPGPGPCHPAVAGLCADVLRPVVVDAVVAGGVGAALFAEHVPGSMEGPVWLQAVVVDGAASGTTPVVARTVTSFRADWVLDRAELSATFGESGYDVGMAETAAFELGWYGEDCFLGYPMPSAICHSVVNGRVRTLDSVHPYVGGGGINDVVPDATTLFYGGPGGMGGDGGPPGGDHPALTYVFIGHDSGRCWTFGDAPAYYVRGLGCTELW